MNLYDRLLLKRLTKNFLLSLTLLLALFFIFDFTLTKSEFPRSLFIYYTSVFSLQGEFLISIAFALALIRTLLDANSHFELTSLQIAGNSLLKITRATFVFAFALVGLNLLNFELVYPKAWEIVDGPVSRAPQIERVLLSDHSELFYNAHLSSPALLRDLFWIKSPQEIWHIHSLETFPPYRARGIDQFDSAKEKIEYLSTTEEALVDMGGSELIPSANSYQHLALKKLHTLLAKKTAIPLDTHKVHIQLYNKWLMSLLPLLLCILLLPFTTRYYKAIPFLKIYGISLFVFILAYFIIRISIIFAQSELLPPFAIVAFPLILLLVSLCGRKSLLSSYILSRSC